MSCLPCTLAHSANLQIYLLFRSLCGAFAAFAHIFISLETGPLVGKNEENRRAQRVKARERGKGVPFPTTDTTISLPSARDF